MRFRGRPNREDGAHDARSDARPAGGDWHGNAAWARSVIRRLPELLPDESPRIVLHAGDFGIWPGPQGWAYLRGLDLDLARVGGVLWFVDGNHEDHPRLAELPDAGHQGGHGRVSDRIFHLRRGHRWTWHGRTWLALGGAVSLDRAVRAEGMSWWPEEEIAEEEARRAIAGGPADVMLTHDCPARVAHEFSPLPSFWDGEDLKRSDAHRELLQTVVDAVKPGHLFHGHLHRAYTRDVAMPHGQVRVTGFDCDGVDGNWGVLDVAAMKWERPVA
ncbi:metallophosphoesterase [Actinomadura madurae]|uniref:metallophosphoesterase n=1 Tax=Actinomadura madurae TaxID=1993 RepID=UPI0020D22061|nr:metallophosphoesterase [Actinomadura madurae]MCP9964555.1 metallophosphoesterase [Actinomadura madurae]